MVHVAMAAVDETGIDAEVIDLRSLVPLDIETIISSVTKTGSCVIVHEATLTGGFGAELAALVQHRCFYSLESRIERIAGWDTPYPHAFEWNYFPCQIRSPIQNPPCSAGPSTDDIFRDGLLEMITAWAYLDAVNVVCWLNDAEPCEPDSGLHPGECDRRARLACAGG